MDGLEGMLRNLRLLFVGIRRLENLPYVILGGLAAFSLLARMLLIFV